MTIHRCPKCQRLEDCKLDFCGDPIESLCEDCSTVCILEKEEMIGYELAKKSKRSNAVSLWKMAIAEKYNMTTLNFTVDKKGRLHKVKK